MRVKKMIMNIYMFRMGRNRRRGRKSNGSLVIRENRERVGNRKVQEGQENMQPQGFFECMSEGVIFGFSGGKGNCALLHHRPGDE